MNADIKGPQFIQYMQPVLDALNELGGSGRPAEVKEIIADKYQLSDEELNATISSGQKRFSNNVDWCRFYLAKAGYIDSSVRGVWSLTEAGRNIQLSDANALDIFHEIQNLYKVGKKDKAKITTSIVEEVDTPDEIEEEFDHRGILLEILLGLSSTGFEQVCQRLLRESGFEKVTITGRSGDGGIDGIGVLQMTPFVSFKVLFQCKRYSGSVSPSHIRDFRGAMQGRADKGIIITTGAFTKEAKREAVRDGVPPIELVDGEKLVDMFEHLELGLLPKTAYDVDLKFFEQFS